MPTRIQPLVTPSQLGVLLLGARRSLKLTQAELGARVGLNQRRISELERAPSTLSVEQLMALCAQLGLRLAIESRELPSLAADEPAGEW
jgi:HTH-type transcriptional regulator/antitoxin HipB